MSSLVSANIVATGQVQSLDSVRGHSLPSDALIFTSATSLTPANQNPGSYSLVESGTSALGFTVTGSVPVVTQSPFPDLYKEGSLYLNGTVGNYIQNTATYTSTQWNTGGLTIEAWVNYQTFANASVTQTISPTSIQLPTLVGTMQPGTNSNVMSFGANVSSNVSFFYQNGSGVQSVMSTTPLSANTWNHIAVSIAPAGFIYIFINGVQSQVVQNYNGTGQAASYYGTVQGTPVLGGTNTPLTIGEYNGASPNVYLADLRITTGAGLYTGSTSSYATFTVPSAPLGISSSGTTQFLLRAGQNSPTIQNGALTFDRGLKQYLNFGPQTFNIVTQGFTAVWRGAFTGTVGNFDNIFQFTSNSATLTNSANSNAILLSRTGTTGALYFVIQPLNNASGPSSYNVNTGNLSQGVVYVVTVRYSPVTQLMDMWVNGVFQGSTAATTAQLVGDRTLGFTSVGFPAGGSSFPSMSSNTLAVYNRALSNTEIYNSYLALAETPLQPQNATLEIGDVNSTPALRVTGDGRVQLQKLGATSNVLPWPPAAMTGYVTSINGQNYVASASSEYPGSSSLAWNAFDKTVSTQWASNGGLYTVNTGVYTGSVVTTDVNGSPFRGEWLQIQLPNPVVLSSFYVNQQNCSSVGPTIFYILGSRDGVNWFLIYTGAGSSSIWLNSPYSQTYTFQPSQAFTYFRYVVNNTIGGGGSSTTYNAAEVIYYGTADLQQPLTVAQPVTLTYGAQTASLTGIANPGVFVPQDFSSSALNIPAFVVSNTTTVANTVAFSSFGPFAGEGSLYFPGGTGAYVQIPSSAVSFWPGGLTTFTDGTIEAWIYLTKYNSTSNTIIIGRGVSSGTFDWLSNVSSSGVLTFSTYGGNGTTTGGTVPLNAWNHIAVSSKSNSINVFLNGVISATPITYSGTLTGSSTDPLFISTPLNTINGYIACARIISGQALYTTSFVPPTAPLQPLQGTTQAGLPYGTVLLLRNAPVPGRVLTQKFAGQNSFVGPGSGSPGTVSFPPAAMTGYSTSLNAGYGQGTYVASASSEYQNAQLAWYAFDKNTSTTYWCSAPNYTANTPYSGSVVTNDVNGNTYKGEWVQIQLPSSIILSNYSIFPQASGPVNTPASWYILGSRDGASWYLIDQRSNVPGWNGTYNTYQVQSSQAFTYFRFVCFVVSTNTSAAFEEWTLNGSIEGVNVSADGRLGVGVTAPVQSLEVAGSAVVAGTVSAGNPLMFRNRIINGNFNVWQRGTTFTSTAGTYSADRWVEPNNGQTVTTAQSTNVPFRAGFQYSVSLTTTFTTGSSALVEQRIEQLNTYDLYQGTLITVSFWAAQTAGTLNTLIVQPFTPFGVNSSWGGSVYPVATTPLNVYLPLSSNWQYYTGTFAVSNVSVSTNGLGLQFYYGVNPSNPTTTLITGVQLEKGTVATPFEYRPYATELALCQRYYTQLNAGSTYARFGTAYSVTTTSSNVYIPLPVTMRAQPTLTMTIANFRVDEGSSQQTVTSVTPASGSAVTDWQLNAAGLTVGHSAVAAANLPGFLEANGTTSAFLGFSSEL